MLKQLIEANRRVSAALARSFPQTRLDISARYYETVIDRMAGLGPDTVIVDVGGGRNCRFARFRPPGSRITAVDVSEAELRCNRDVDETRVGDCSVRIPMDDGTADLIVSSSAIEHFPDVTRFVRESARVLKPGGHFVHLLPSKFAPYAVLNRALPHRLARRLVHTIFPGTEHILGFRAHYDHCSLSAFRSLLYRSGLRVEECVVSYSQSWYFSFCVPLFIASASYELAVSLLGLSDLAAYVLVSGTRLQDRAGRWTPSDSRAIPGLDSTHLESYHRPSGK